MASVSSWGSSASPGVLRALQVPWEVCVPGVAVGVWGSHTCADRRSLSVSLPTPSPACKRKEQEPNKERNNSQKKSRLVFTDLQRRTLFAIFKENKRPSKEMQITISQQLGLELTTVSNFFMNARRRSLEKWQDDLSSGGSSSAPSTCTKA
ncbi:one cut domain family member 2 [Limosa lapponica baueri]|uniref:One cut domain family member 2 n=1 Tax=Limosa lapponica baueri TaxID=1758121 RepID=A0A2I0T4L7_LIMLA|nr:one cut domain family member 2 [Limosa lapponica baueri]